MITVFLGAVYLNSKARLEYGVAGGKQQMRQPCKPVKWVMLVVAATPEAEAGELLKARIWRTAWATQADAISKEEK